MWFRLAHPTLVLQLGCGGCHSNRSQSPVALQTDRGNQQRIWTHRNRMRICDGSILMVLGLRDGTDDDDRIRWELFSW